MSEDTSILPLDMQEARLLGCLVEKEATTPDQYPLTVNAARTAANQKTAREPVLSLDAGAVHHALRELERKGLAKQVFSSRAERYEHRADACFSVSKPQLTLLGLLLLRGAQTLHELLARSERMHAFADVEDVRHHLDRLMQREPALVTLVPRASGQREDRFAHLLCGDVPVAQAGTGLDRNEPGPGPASSAGQALDERIEALEQEVAALRARLESLERGGTG